MKNLTITTLLLFAVSIAFSQDNPTDNREKIQIGGKAGLSLANVYDAEGNEFDSDHKYGYTGGIFISIPLGSYFGVQPEVTITQKGFKGKGSLLGSTYEFNRTSTFLEIPILISFKPSEFLTILAGPQYGYLLKQKDEFTSSAFSYSQEKEFEQENVRKNLFGLMMGADITVQHIVIGGRIGWDLQNNKGDGTSTTVRYKNVCGQLTLGYRL